MMRPTPRPSTLPIYTNTRPRHLKVAQAEFVDSVPNTPSKIRDISEGGNYYVLVFKDCTCFEPVTVEEVDKDEVVPCPIHVADTDIPDHCFCQYGKMDGVVCAVHTDKPITVEEERLLALWAEHFGSSTNSNTVM